MNADDRKPMASWDDDYEFSFEDYVDLEEPDHTGTVQVRRYSDGSSTVDFGPMGGKVNYNQFGEEC